jgi:pyruvate, orthophosphate dikinase
VNDADLTAEQWQTLTSRFKTIFRSHTQVDFPQDPVEQLKMATEAVFKSWNGKRAVDYRNAAGIAHDLGTAVSIVSMVFGNMGDDSATGVAMTRNGSTGEPKMEGDYLINAQGEDVVAGIRMTKDIDHLATEMPDAYTELLRIARILEQRYRDMQDMEFTIEKGKLWMLQTRDGKRTAQAAVRIAVDMVDEAMIDKEEAVSRVTPGQIDFFLHPQFENQALVQARAEGKVLAKGLNVSPGAAFGVVAFDADVAETWSQGAGQAGDHGAAGDQTRRCARHAGGPGHSHQPRRPDQPRRPGRAPVRQTGGGRGRGADDRFEQAPHERRRAVRSGG